MRLRSAPVSFKLRPRVCNSKDSLARQECKNMKIKLSCRRELDSESCKSTKNRHQRRQVALKVRLGGPIWAQETPSCAWSAAWSAKLDPRDALVRPKRRQVEPKKRPRGSKLSPRGAQVQPNASQKRRCKLQVEAKSLQVEPKRQS